MGKYFWADIQLPLIGKQEHVSHSDYMLQFSGLFLHLGCQEEGTWGNRVPMELGEGMEHVESVQVHNCCIDA